MIKKIYSSIISLFRSNQKEELKNVIEDLIDENKSSTEKIDDGTKNIFKNVINLKGKIIQILRTLVSSDCSWDERLSV